MDEIKKIDFLGLAEINKRAIEYNERLESSEEQKKIEEENERQQRKARHAYYKECNVEPEFYDKTLADYIPKTVTQQKAKDYVAEIINNKQGQLVLLGGNGLGKTMLASVAAMKLNGKIYSMYEISTMIRQSYTVKAEKSELEIVNELAKTPFLAIDELGRTKGGEAEQNWLSYVLDKRHVRKLPFILISNGHFKSACPNGGCSKCFENFVDNDILSRLRESAHFVVMDGQDERMNRRENLNKKDVKE